MTALSIAVDAHPLLDLVAFETTFEQGLGDLAAVAACADLLRADASAPLASSDEVRAAIRDLLRFGGYKPTGRGKPASEYLIRAASEGSLVRINLAVDACNAVSLHSGLPISVVDLDRTKGTLSVRIAPKGTAYVFNASGQTIDVDGLLCLFDADGPCANAVKDSQRTKTHEGTTRTATVIWGSKKLAGRAEQAFDWYAAILGAAGARIERCDVRALAEPS